MKLLGVGDRKAIELLYDYYADNIYGLVYTILRDEGQAQDVVQDVFIKVWKKSKSYDKSKGRLFTWVLNIARNRAIDVLRSKERKQTRATLMAVSDANSSSDLGMIKQTDHVGLKDLVTQLNTEQKQVIDLIYFGGFTQVETAEELDIPLGTVKTRVKIAMRELRKVFQV